MNNRSPEEPMREEQTPLAKFVREKLTELHIRQTEFCRLTGFDQGLLSKIQNSMVSTLSLESALKLAIGLRVQPRILLELIGRPDLNDLVLKAYGNISIAPEDSGGSDPSNNVVEVRKLAERAQSLGKDLAPIKKALHSLLDDRSCSPGKEPASSAGSIADIASSNM